MLRTEPGAYVKDSSRSLCLEQSQEAVLRTEPGACVKDRVCVINSVRSLC